MSSLDLKKKKKVKSSAPNLLVRHLICLIWQSVDILSLKEKLLAAADWVNE